MAHQDIIELARIKHRCLNILPFTSLLSMITLIVYLGYRVKYLFISKLPTDDPYEHWNSWVYLVAELGLYCEWHLPDTSVPPLLSPALTNPLDQCPISLTTS